MSVYIKGIDVPKEGTVIVIDSTGQVWSNEWPTRGYTRIDGAKAVPVAEHGRLIDADALAEASCKGVCSDCEDMYKGNNVKTNCSEVRLNFLRKIRNAPTIIPADKEGEG